MSNDKTAIEWTDSSWNPVTGCSKVSDGCRFCYAEALSHRFGHTRKPWTHPFAAENVVLHPERLDQPLRWRTPRRIFVNSMSDLFHELVPDAFVAETFAIMALCPQHTFQILTKRPERMARFVAALVAGKHDAVVADAISRHYRDEGQRVRVGPSTLGSWLRWPLRNVWLGTSVEDQRAADERIRWLVETPAAVRFLSCEPLLGPVDLTRIAIVPPQPPYRPGVLLDALRGLYAGPDGLIPEHRVHWVITGGESGPRHRRFDPQWARDIRDACQAAGIAFLHKQNGGLTPKSGGRLLDGREWNEFPKERSAA